MGRSKKKAPPTRDGVLMKEPVPESEVKRRLKPIDSALNSDNAKQAIKLCNHALSKRPGWPAARALKACAMVKQNMRTEAIALISEIIADIDAKRVPLDKDACDKISLAYRHTRQPALAAAIKERLWLQDMSVLEYGEAAYSCFICAHMFEEARKTALRLMRLKSWKTIPYTVLMGYAVWLDMQLKSIRSDTNDETVVDIRMLKVASMQIAKVLGSDDVSPQRETVHFATKFFMDSNMYEEARNLVTKAKKSMAPKENLVLLANVEKKAGDLAKAASLYRRIVTEIEPDDWQCWVHYFDCIDVTGEGKEEVWNTLVPICEMAEKTLCRGPFIAKMEVLLRHGRSEELRDDIVSFFGLFSNKPRCKYDLRRYVDFLVKEDVVDNLFDLIDVAVDESGSVTSHINMCWLLLWCNRLDLNVDELVSRYKLELEKQTHTMNIDGDDYLLLAVHKLLPLPAATNRGDGDEERYKNKRNIMRAIVILEYGFGRSIHTSYFKLILTILYSQLMYTERAYAMWLSLDIKPIQAPSLSYLVLNPLFSMSNFNDLQNLNLLFTGYWFQIDSDLPKSINLGLSNAKFNATANLVLFRHRQARFAILAKSALISALLEVRKCDSEGVEKAWNLIGDGSRFPSGKKEEAQGLTYSSDGTVLNFWNTHLYDPDEFVDEHNETESELGKLVPLSVQNTIFSQLRALKRVLQLVKGLESDIVEGSDGIDDALKANTSSVTNEEGVSKNALMPDCMVSPDEVARAAFADSFSRLLVDIRNKLVNVGKADNVANGSIHTIDTSSYVDALCVHLRDEATSVEKGLSGIEAGNYFELVPKSLAACGNFVGVTLVIVTLGIGALSPVLAQKTRQAKKMGDVANEVNDAEKTISELKRAAIQACSVVSDALRGFINGGEYVDDIVKWLDVENIAPFLPPKLELVRVAHEGSLMLEHTEFAQNMVSDIVESHKNGAGRMLISVNGMAQKLKLSHP